MYVCVCLYTSKYVSAWLCMFMYMSLYVCVCLCIYVYLCMPLYVNVCLCMPLFYVCLSLCMHMCVYVLCMCVCVYVCVRMSVYACACLRVCTFVYHGDRHIQRPPPNIQQQQVCTASRQHPVFHPSCQSDWSARVLSSVVHVWEILPFSAHIIDCNDGLNALVPSSSELPQKLAPERFFYIYNRNTPWVKE